MTIYNPEIYFNKSYEKMVIGNNTKLSSSKKYLDFQINLGINLRNVIRKIQIIKYTNIKRQMFTDKKIILKL